MTLIFGFHPVIEAIKAKVPVKEILLAKRADVNEIIKLASKLNIPIRNISNEDLRKLTASSSHQGIAAKINEFAYLSIDQLLKKISKKTNPIILVLDSIKDPHNLGAIIRTAVCFGIDGIILPKDRACGITPAVYKASAGVLHHISVTVVTNISRALDFLKKHNFWIYGIEKRETDKIENINCKTPIALVLGGEDTGIRPLVLKKCDAIYTIPISEQISSLNVSVAAAIVMYETRKNVNEAL